MQRALGIVEIEIHLFRLNIVSQVSTEFQDIPVKQLGRNLDAAERLVALVSSSTDIQTRALLQEHLRYEIDFEVLYRQSFQGC